MAAVERYRQDPGSRPFPVKRAGLASVVAALICVGCQRGVADAPAVTTEAGPTKPDAKLEVDDGGRPTLASKPALPAHVSCTLFGPKEVLEIVLDFDGDSGRARGTLRRYGGSRLPNRFFRVQAAARDDAVALFFDGYLPEDKRSAQATEVAVRGTTTLGRLLRTDTTLKFLPDGELDVSRGLGSPVSEGAYRCDHPTNVP